MEGPTAVAASGNVSRFVCPWMGYRSRFGRMAVVVPVETVPVKAGLAAIQTENEIWI